MGAESETRSTTNRQEFGGGQIAPIDLASTVVIPESGVREAKTEEIGNIVKSVGFGREVVSIDWVSRCIKDDRLVDYDTYRITLPSIQTPTETPMDVETTVEEAPGPEPAPAVEMEVEAVPASVPGPMVQMEVAASPAPAPPVIQVEPLPASPSAINSPHQRPLSLKPRKRNATAGPSGTRHSTAPRTIEIIMIDDDESDDDFVMLDTPPIIVKKSVTPDIKRKLSHVEDRYPTPPMTPLAPDNERTRSPSQERLDTTITPIAVETASEEYDPSDHIPLQRPQKRKPFTEMPLGLITDPEQRERDVQTHVPLYWRKKFRIMEKELHEWAKEDFKGPVVSFDARMFAKVSYRIAAVKSCSFFSTLRSAAGAGRLASGSLERCIISRFRDSLRRATKIGEDLRILVIHPNPNRRHYDQTKCLDCHSDFSHSMWPLGDEARLNVITSVLLYYILFPPDMHFTRNQTPFGA
jgi:hypothetical protein